MYKVLIRDNQTGEGRWYVSPEDWTSICAFLWTEGNYGCDCNRGSFFAQASGHDEERAEHKCGDERYTAIYAELPDGTQVMLDG